MNNTIETAIKTIKELEDVGKVYDLLEDVEHAYNMSVGKFYVDGMSKESYGIYYTIDAEEGYDEYFISFDVLVEGWHIVPNPENPNEFGWGFNDQR